MDFLTIIKILAIIIIGVSILKKSIKTFIYLNIALFLFSVIFIQNGSDLQESLNLKDDNILISFFDDFNDKRNQYKIVDANKVYNKIDNTIEGSTDYIKENGKKILNYDLDDISNKLSNSLIANNLEDIDYKTLNDSIKDIYKHLSNEDQNDLTVKTINKIKEKTPN